ncbi:UNVERIFIED_CONTAM: Retrovirus-related Pol polyprotein from transposon TNT 1-94 [Sesamum latifolium]|uniref:Retrovirus-related Pol polyprotein from transposon TNT 1-94 n=1 Tax=Sesamum latifolium TaxID=2727402 RepID=A0AAW2YB09_9LAMI
MTTEHKRKVDDHENAQIWHARLGHISKDRIRKLVDSNSLEIDGLYHLPTCESCLKGKMTKKRFVGQSTITNSLLDLVHTDVCGPLNTPARGGFSYFISFIDDHSRYGYVYLMSYKSEAFERFKEYKLEVEKQTGRKIKALRSDRGDEYLSGEFIDHLKEVGILSQWTPPGTPQLNGVAERRNRTLLDIVWSIMSFIELSPSFWGYALETAAKLLSIAPSKTVPQTPYEIWHGKLRPTMFLKKGFPSDSRRDEVLIESNEEPQHDSTTSFEPPVQTNSVSVLRRLIRESRASERYGFVRLISQLDNDLKTYGEAMSDTDSDKWLEVMDSMGSNQVWTLVDPPKGVRPVGCKWVYKRKLGADGKVMTFKARLMAKGYTQRPRIDFEETYSPVDMAKSIRILLAITAWYDYEIWQMNVKTAFLNGFVEEEIFMDQPEGFTTVGKNRKSVVPKGPSTASSKLPETGTHILMKSYGVMISSRTIMVLGIKIYRDRSKRLLGLTQSSYIEKVLKRFKIEHSKQGLLPTRHGVKLSKKQSSKTDEELKRMSNIPYASVVGSIQYAVQCTKSDVAYALSVTSRYHACAAVVYSGAVKSILKYLKRTKDMFLIYGGGKLILEGYSDASFQSDDDDAKSNRVLYSSLMVVWSLGRVPSRIPQRIPPRKLNTLQLRKLLRRQFG